MANVNFKLENDILTIFLEGRIDSANAQDVDSEVESIFESNTFNDVIIDTDTLEYVSSAGLRDILKWKKAHRTLSIINASLEVYNIFEMTGFTDIIDIQKGYKKMSVDGLTEIGHGAKGIVYRYNNDTVVKVYKNADSLEEIKKERLLAKKAFTLGLPTAISYDVVKVGDKFGSVFELLDSRSLSIEIEEGNDIEKSTKIFTDLLKDIHSLHDDTTTLNAKDLVYNRIERCKDILGDNRHDKIKALVDSIEVEDTLLHMDFHTNNILIQNGEALMIDMDTLSHGNIIFEISNIYCTYEGFRIISDETVEKFLKITAKHAEEFYSLFLKMYFGDKLNNDIIKKIELLGLLRVIAHTLKRKDKIDNHQEVFNECLKRIDNCLEVVSDLNINL